MSGIPIEDERERIRDANPIEDVVAEYVDLVRRGNVFKGLCPFHPDSNPSMDVNPQRQTYRCWSCGEHGDVYSFIQMIEGVEFPEAKQKLADRVGIEVHQFRSERGREQENEQDLRILDRAASWFQRQFQTETGSAARSYLQSRGFDDSTLARFRIGYAPPGWSHLNDDLGLLGDEAVDVRRRAFQLGLLKEKDGGRYYDAFRDRIIFPILDYRRERVIGFGGRHLGSAELASGDAPPKYINSPESKVFSKKRVLYGRREGRLEISRERRVILCEGYTDVMMAHQCGFPTAVATLGTAFTDEHVVVLKRLVSHVDLILDGDEAGQMAAERACERFMGTGLEVRVVILDDGVDPCDLLLQEQGKQRFEGLLESGVDPIEFIVKQIQGRHPGQGASAAQQMMEEISRVVLDPYHDQQVALEAAAGQVARVIGVTEPMVLADHTRLRQQRSPRRIASAISESTQKSRLPDEEEAILVAILRDPDQAELLLKLRPAEMWSDPLRRSLAIRIGQLGRNLDPVHIEDDEEKSLYLDLDARVDREDEITADDDREAVRYNTSLDLVRAFLTDMNGRTGPGKKDSQRTIDINKAIQSMDLDRESHQNPSLLLQIINTFEGGKKSDAPAR